MTIPLGNGASPKWNWISVVLLIFVFAFMGYWVNANDKRIEHLELWKDEHLKWSRAAQLEILTDTAAIKAQLAVIRQQLEDLKEQNKRLTSHLPMS